jgi:hypothetical protein
VAATNYNCGQMPTGAQLRFRVYADNENGSSGVC